MSGGRIQPTGRFRNAEGKGEKVSSELDPFNPKIELH